jgi:hypothetical protein
MNPPKGRSAPPREAPSAAMLADEVFALVQFDQGKGFVSDGLNALRTTAKVFEIVRGHLWHTERAAELMKNWLRKYGELAPPRRKRKP